MFSFRLITEGITDQFTLKNILSIFYDDPNIDVEPLQPLCDETDRYTQKNYGGWAMVFEYLKSKKFKDAIAFTDYFIIQIDTDVSPEFGIPHQEAGRDLTLEQLYTRVKEKIISSMDMDFYDKHKDRFIFAISIHSIECWFLPLYYSNKRKSTPHNCLYILNQRLESKERFTIDRKNPRYYETISKKFKNKRRLISLAANNLSFKIFLESLPSIHPDNQSYEVDK
ncbi:MAG: phage tail protein [Acidobacteria bacterium]|jgi:hypothetical protein|nr:phage tail protein [Acidobacteriota bacterium]